MTKMKLVVFAVSLSYIASFFLFGFVVIDCNNRKVLKATSYLRDQVTELKNEVKHEREIRLAVQRDLQEERARNCECVDVP